MFFENWLRIFTREEILAPHAKVVEKQAKPAAVVGKYDDDIAAIRAEFGADVKEIEISLQDLLKLCPRNRPRTDAYKGLVAELKAEGIELRIVSRKKNCKKEA